MLGLRGRWTVQRRRRKMTIMGGGEGHPQPSHPEKRDGPGLGASLRPSSVLISSLTPAL